MNFIDQNGNEINEINKRKNRLLRRSWLIALCILAFGTTLYSEIEGQWLSSYGRFIANLGYFTVAFIVAMSGISVTIFYLMWGAISDNIRTKFGRRVPIIVIGMLSTALLMFLYISTTNFLILLLIGGFLLGFTSSMFHVSNKSLIGDLTPIEKRGRINSILFVFTNMGSLMVWLPAILLLPEGEQSYSTEIHLIFIGGGALILITIGILIYLLVKEPEVNIPRRKWSQDIKQLFNRQEMMQHKGFLRLFIAMLFLIMSQNAFLPFLLILLQEVPFDLSEILIILPFIGTGIGLGIYLLGKYTDKIGRRKVVLMCLCLSPIGCFIIAFSGTNYLLLMIGFGIMMPFNIGIWLATDAWVLDLAPTESRGRFLGIINIGNAFGKVPGVLFAGYLAENFGILSVFLVTGIILWIAIPFFSRVPETIKTNKISR